MKNKEKKYEGFGNKTFDDWYMTLTPEERDCVAEHCMPVFMYKDGSEMCVDYLKGTVIGTSKESMAKSALQGLVDYKPVLVCGAMSDVANWILGNAEITVCAPED